MLLTKISFGAIVVVINVNGSMISVFNVLFRSEPLSANLDISHHHQCLSEPLCLELFPDIMFIIYTLKYPSFSYLKLLFYEFVLWSTLKCDILAPATFSLIGLSKEMFSMLNSVFLSDWPYLEFIFLSWISLMPKMRIQWTSNRKKSSSYTSSV